VTGVASGEMRFLVLPRRLLRSGWADLVLALALFALGQYELWGGATYDGAPVWPGSRLVTAIVVVPLLTLPFAVRRRRPLLSAGLVLGTVAGESVIWGGAEATTLFLALVVAVYSAAANADRRWTVLVVGLGAGSVHLVTDPHAHVASDIVWSGGILVLAWLFGLAVHGRQGEIDSLASETVRLAADRERHAREAVADERLRVARELHDVVAHAVSVVVVQAQAGQRLVGRDDERARESLVAIEDTARTALVEMRRLLGMLRDAEPTTLAPQPGLTRLADLIAGVREAGLDVSLEIDGDPVQLAPGLDLSAYRIVQEGLTNTLKHSEASSALVRVRYDLQLIELTVEDEGPTTLRSPSDASGGRGLGGMRERVALYGGRVESGPAEAGGWRLQARLPLTG
jgi:signal transduction histidine kinase